MVIGSQPYYLSPVVSQGIKETHKSANTNSGIDLIWHSADAGTKNATDTKIKDLKHSEKKTPDRHLDRDQLYLYVLTTGTKSWRLRYRHNGKEDVLVIGLYPQVSLKEARLEGAKARALIVQRTDPKTYVIERDHRIY